MFNKILKFKKYLSIFLIIFLLLINFQLVFAQENQQQSQPQQIQEQKTNQNNTNQNTEQTNTQEQEKEGVLSNIANFFKSLTSTAIAATTGGVVGFIVFAINYLISLIAGAIIALEAWFIEIVLAMNDQIVQTSFVQSGFLISLSVANLIFVAGIIIIAIATILRWESYSIKKILWKLIVMAVLVNFSLTISGAIINISSNFSNYFLNAVNPSGSESSYAGFATAIAGVFSPQRFFINKNAAGKEMSIADPNKIQKDEDLIEFAGEGLAATFKPLISIFFVILFLINIIIVLGALFIMLLIRYVEIGFLLILAPLAWTLWVFDNTKQYWTQWWNNFLKWTFFAPLVLFFLYLSILTLKGTPGGSGGWITGSSNGAKINGVEFSFKSKNSGPLGAIQTFIGTALGDLTVTIIEMIMAIGLTTGSLIAANKLGIKGAEGGIKLANSINDGAKNWAKNRAKGYGAEKLTQTEPKQYTGWRKIFNPINKLTHKATAPARAIAERMGYAPKLQEIAEKYGSKPREQRKKNIKAAKDKIKKINEQIKKSPELIAEVKKKYEQQIKEETDKFKDQIKASEDKINKLIDEQTKIKSDQEKGGQTEDKQKKLKEIEEQIEIEKEKIKELRNKTDNVIKKLRENLSNEIVNLTPEKLINERRKLYEAIARAEAFDFELETDASGNSILKGIKEKQKPGEPLTLFGSMMEKASGKFKPKKTKKKISKKDLEEIEIDEETIKQIAEKMDIDIDIEEKEKKQDQEEKEK